VTDTNVFQLSQRKRPQPFLVRTRVTLNIGGEAPDHRHHPPKKGPTEKDITDEDRPSVPMPTRIGVRRW
jgi:hypothetical protein